MNPPSRNRAEGTSCPIGSRFSSMKIVPGGNNLYPPRRLHRRRYSRGAGACRWGGHRSAKWQCFTVRLVFPGTASQRMNPWCPQGAEHHGPEYCTGARHTPWVSSGPGRVPVQPFWQPNKLNVPERFSGMKIEDRWGRDAPSGRFRKDAQFARVAPGLPGASQAGLYRDSTRSAACSRDNTQLPCKSQ
jgi:hypothetical protein